MDIQLDNFSQKYNLDRKAAAKRLKVSVRTVDRYVKKKVLAAQNVGGRVWLNKDEVDGFSANQQAPTIDTHYDTSTPDVTIDTTSDKIEQNIQRLSTSQTRGTLKTAPTSPFFKELYQKTKEELQEKQERLEVANYRVGQLEAQVKNSVPLLEYHREAAEKKLQTARLEEHLDQSEKKFVRLVKRLKIEESNKKLFLTVLLVLLSLQPLWLLLLSK